MWGASKIFFYGANVSNIQCCFLFSLFSDSLFVCQLPDEMIGVEP